MPSFHITDKEWNFWLNSVTFSSIFINCLTTITRECLQQSEAYHQYVDQKDHANLLTHGNTYSALQITSDSICQNMTLKSEKLHISKEWSLPSVLIPQHKKLGT